MERIYLVGNQLIPSDNLPIRLKPLLQDAFPTIYFINIDPTEGIPTDEKNPIFLDTIVGIPAVTVFDSLNAFAAPPRFTPHDYDLFLELSLMKKLHKLESFTIIGVPQNMKEQKAINEVKKVLLRLYPFNL